MKQASLAHIMLRPATVADAELLLAWRNDPGTRAMSHNTNEVPLDEHIAWLNKILLDHRRGLYIAELDGRPVGTVRADVVDEVTELSWTVAPSERGKGLGRRMVRTLATSLRNPLRAEVKVGNSASVRIAYAAGMSLQKTEGGVMHFFRKALS